MKKIEKETYNQPPLLCWDVYRLQFFSSAEKFDDKFFLENFLKRKNCDLPRKIMDCLNNYDAIVLTDIHQIIKWSSSGFTNMTGYQRSEAVGRRPSFLQGEKTDPVLRDFIKQRIKGGESVKSSLINYTKYGKEYRCDIHIEPIWERKDLTHFIAFEKEVALESSY